MSEKVRVGVLGVKRGTGLVDYCVKSGNGKFKVVAICDKWIEGLAEEKKKHQDKDIAFYSSFDDFIKHDMDAVVLANYGNEHAPFAVRCLDRGLHVFSEVTACQNMKEAVELVEAAEKSGKVYALGEQYCFMPAPREMKKYYEAGKLGELELADCEYAHDSSDAWHRLTFGDPNHWRNRAYSTFYCTHSIGPILHATGLRPVSVTGYESYNNERRTSVGARTASFGVSMITLDNGAIIKALNGNLRAGTLWYAMYGSKGKMESARSITRNGGVGHFTAETDGDDGKSIREDLFLAGDVNDPDYDPYGGAIHICFGNFIDRVLGDADADVIGVYEALDMTLPGLFAYRSILQGGIPLEVPDMRDPDMREKYRNDTLCTDPAAAGDMLVPACSRGEPKIDPSVYERIRLKFLEEMEKGEFKPE